MFPMGLANHVRNPRRSLVSTQVSSWVNFNPLSFSPSVWLDASVTDSITSSSGSVTQWNDLSGNGRNVVTTGAATKPLTGTRTQNGRNVIAFDGTSSGLISATGATAFPIVNIFVVARSEISARLIFGHYSSFPITYPFFRWSIYHTTNTIFEMRLNSSLFQPTYTLDRSKPHIFRMETNNGDAYVDGIRVIDMAGQTVTYPNVTSMTLGATSDGVQVLQGFIAEVILFNRAMTAIETQSVENYLQNKWAIY